MKITRYHLQIRSGKMPWSTLPKAYEKLRTARRFVERNPKHRLRVVRITTITEKVLDHEIR